MNTTFRYKTKFHNVISSIVKNLATISIKPCFTMKAIALVLNVIFNANKVRYSTKLRLNGDLFLKDQMRLSVKLSNVAITVAMMFVNVKFKAVPLISRVKIKSSVIAVDPPTNIYFINCFRVSLFCSQTLFIYGFTLPLRDYISWTMLYFVVNFREIYSDDPQTHHNTAADS